MMQKIINPLRFCWRSFLSVKRWIYQKSIIRYDANRFRSFNGYIRPEQHRESALARIVMSYHMIEKGLTMPRRRLGFGQDGVLGLMGQIEDFELRFPGEDVQVNHAIGVVHEYMELHKKEGYEFGDRIAFWQSVEKFCRLHNHIKPTSQRMFTREEFYSNLECAFPVFSASRHTCRHFAGPISQEKMEKAVALAINCPSACNRQHARVHCIVDHSLLKNVLSLQGGNRGFGSDADKLLIVTGDLRDVRWLEERNDLNTNVGMFLMNLCYALHYYKIAHCILNWSVPPKSDQALRKLVPIPDSENIVALIACGAAPDRFLIASSPRKRLDSVLTVYGNKCSE